MLCALCQQEKDCDDNDTSMATATATELFKYPTLPINKIINDATMSPRPEVAMMLNSKSLHDTPTSINFGTDTNTPVSLTSRSTTTNNAVSTNKTIAQTVTARKKPTVQSERRKKSTCRKSAKKGSSVRIGLKVRVKSQRQQLFHILTTDAQRNSMSVEVGNNYNYYGTVVGGNSFKGWNVQYDLLPHGENIIKGVNRTKLVVVTTSEGEVTYDHDPPPNIVDGILAPSSDEEEQDPSTEISPDAEKEASVTNTKKKKKSAARESIDRFCSMPKSDIAKATTFQHCFGSQKKLIVLLGK